MSQNLLNDFVGNAEPVKIRWDRRKQEPQAAKSALVSDQGHIEHMLRAEGF
jgi:hypothetical protein